MSFSLRAAIYEVEYQEDRDVSFVLSLLDGPDCRVVELPCGAGRLSRHLAGKAGSLDVVDLEPQMVERAVAAANTSAPACWVTGHVQDMRNLSLDHSVDLAILPREGLQLVAPADGSRVLSAIASHIAPGGRILIDLARFSGDESYGDPDYYKPGPLEGSPTPDWVRKLSGGTRLRRCSAQTDEGDSLVFDLNYALASDPPEEWSSQMRIYRYDSDWVNASVPDGMQLEAIYGGYDRSPLDADSSRILALLQKPPGSSR